MSKQSNKDYYQVDALGWGKLLGTVELSSSPASAAGSAANTTGKNYFARFYSPVSAIGQTIKTGIHAGNKYELKFNIANDSATGFFAATVNFLNDAGVPLGAPSSTGIKLSEIQDGNYSPVSFVTEAAPEGTTQAQLVFVAVGTSPEKCVDINRVIFKEVL
ncbi:MAG: hypothetical protein JG781_2088 [Peptococcaceae bacterium]|jgi:hypothetical protein|nr:hypothetical protein [Peptococcaceae bacterium]